MKHMTGKRNSRVLMDHIFQVTSAIQQEYPALYNLLSETPLSFSYAGKDISTASFEQYLESLRRQLAAFRSA
ncbi:MAG: hypothetical protein IT260_20685 [Saprospiraceae bacterium]|nr:hypothetical protein [Saprospiraceae bacterium]